MTNISNNLAKGCITTIMWGAATGVIAIVAAHTSSGDMPLVVVMAMLMALVGTIVMWGLPEIARIVEARNPGVESGGKAKRQQGDKLALLMEMMDEGEREAFKRKLQRQVLDDAGYHDAYDDGELPVDADTLESLLDEDHLRR